MPEAKQARVGADSARRVLELLFAFSEDRPVVSVRELADKTDVPLPSAHRYVALLRELGLVAEGERGRYHLTPRVAALGRAAQAAASLIDLAEPFMRELAHEIGETVLLAQLVDGRPVCVHRVEANRRLRLSFDPGQDLPPVRGASVKVLVGSMPEPDRLAYIDRWLSGSADDKRQRAEFVDEVARASTRGWSTSSHEIDDGVWAAASLVTEGEKPVAALSAACADFRLDDAHREHIVDQVRATAERISQAVRG